MGNKNQISEFVNLQECFRMIAEMVTDGIFEYDVKKDLLLYIDGKDNNFTNKIVMDKFSSSALNYVHPDDVKSIDNLIFEMKIGIEEIRGEFRWQIETGEYVWLAVQGHSIYGKNQKPQYVVGRMYNLDAQRKNEIKMFKDSQRDSLTRLYNKKHLEDYINHYIEKHNDERCAYLVINIDDFKWINDNLGYLFGDEILANVAKTIQNSFYNSDFVGRIGGDEFVVFMKDIKTVDWVAKKVEKLLNKIKEVYIGEKRQQGITASIGISLYPDHGTSNDLLLEKAKLALEYVKRNEKKNFLIYDEEKSEGLQAVNIRKKSAKEQYTTFEKTKKIEFQDFGYELTDFAFELMEETKDVDSVVNLLLHKVALYFQLSVVRIRLVTDKKRNLKYVYECILGDVTKKITTVEEYSEKEWKVLTTHFENGVYIYNDKIDTMDASFINHSSENEVYRSSLQMPLYMSNQFAGCIDFCDTKNTRNWDAKDIHTLKTFSRIISSYLLNMKAFNAAKLSVTQLIERDSLTGLWKYEKFLEMLKAALSKEKKRNIAIIFSDIRHFKYINETYGYNVGDELLQTFSKILDTDEVEIITASRVYSDNIIAACYIEEGITEEEFRDGINAFNYKMEEQLQTRYLDSKLSICTGVYVIKDYNMTVETAVSNANLARKEAKRNEKKGVILFDEKYVREINRQVELISDFPKALKNGEFVVYYQPKVECGSEKIAGAEALVRWKKSDHHFIYPDEFISLFENNGSIVELDYFVFEQVFSYISQRIKENKYVVPISMNVSRVHMEATSVEESSDEKIAMITYVKELFQKYQVPPELIEFELTENIYIKNTDKVLKMIDSLHDMGVKVSMDDFGSGYSSLNLLTKLPIDVIKLDKVFLKNKELEEHDKILICSIVEMAKKMHLSVLCEGVENQEHSTFLSRIGCDTLQGYLFGKPMPLAEFEEYMKVHVSPKVQVIEFNFNNSLEDSTGTYMGTIIGQSVKFVNGPFPGTNALHFPGALPGVEVLELPATVYVSESYTITMWIKEEEKNVWTSVLYTGFENGFNSIIPRSYDMNCMFRIKDEKDINGWYDAGHRKALESGWNHIAATYDAKAELSMVYINGVNAGLREGTYNLFLARRVILGGDIFQNGFKGSIGLLKFYNQPLSATEIKKRYLEELKGNEKGNDKENNNENDKENDKETN